MRRVHSHLRFISTYTNKDGIDTPSKELLSEYIKRDTAVSSPLFYAENRGSKYRQFEGSFGPIPDTIIEMLNTKPVEFTDAVNVIKAVNKFKNGVVDRKSE